MSVNIDKLFDNISQIKPLDQDLLDEMRKEIRSVEIPYKQSYSDFQSGGWHTAMLYAPDSQDDGEISDGVAQPKEIMQSLPKTQQLLDSLGLDYFAVRIAKTDPGACLWEHTDYLELGQEKKLRLHIPLETNAGAIMQFEHCGVQMASGYIWKLDPTNNHAISNDGDTARTHLILDCYVNEELERLINREVLYDKFVTPLPEMDQGTAAAVIAEAKVLLEEEGMKATEHFLLKTFHRYNLGEKSSYDLLIDFYRSIGFADRERYWVEQCLDRVHVREKKGENDNRVNMRGTFFQAAFEDPGLAQFKVLNEVLETCRDIPGLEGAYIRGSLARGDADPFSDIDLLCVVSPEQYRAFIEKADALVTEKHDAILPGWADTIVKDFGGVGHVYLVEREGELFQLDLYIACQGHPGLKRLESLDHKQQVFKAKKDATTPLTKVRAYEDLNYRARQGEVEETIKNLNTPESTKERTFTELCVLSFMIIKCLRRDDPFVAQNEFGMWQKALIKLARQKFDPKLEDYGVYHVQRLADRMNDEGKFVDALRKFYKAELTPDSFAVMHNYAMDFVKEHFPEIASDHANAIEMLKRHVNKATQDLSPTQRTQNKPLTPR